MKNIGHLSYYLMSIITVTKVLILPSTDTNLTCNQPSTLLIRNFMLIHILNMNYIHNTGV